MPIFEYKCKSCLAVFEHLKNKKINKIFCVSCGSENVEKPEKGSFFPKNEFCPHSERVYNPNILSSLN